MKSKSFKHGKWMYKTYCKKVGTGYELGLSYHGNKLFIGNFVIGKEANEFYTKLNKEITSFAKRYWATEDTSVTFYTKFLSNHVNNLYYAYVAKVAPRHQRQYQSAWKQSERKYKKLKNNWYPSEKLSIKKAA